MIDFLRKKVSGKKNRFEEQGLSLDLTYITPRLIAMSLPGEGVHKMYRNSIDSVADLIARRHNQDCLVINISGIRYNYEKFYNNVIEYDWKDHYPPTIELLFDACDVIHEWLYSDVAHVVAVNCKAGKGRTGTLICCYLIFSGRVQEAGQALDYYRFKRFTRGGGVTQPSQIRYVHYFAEIYKRKVRSPLIVSVSEAKIITAPHLAGKSCKPVVEILKSGKIAYSNKAFRRDQQSSFHDDWSQKQEFLIKFEDNCIGLQESNSESIENREEIEKILIYGDIQCNLTNWGKFKNKKICRFTFNTAFIEGNEVRILKNEVDPDKFVKKKNVHQDFAVCLKFEKICECSPEFEFNQRCVKCKCLLDEGEVDKWFRIKEIIKNRIPMNSKVLLFENPELDDVDEVLNGKELRLG